MCNIRAGRLFLKTTSVSGISRIKTLLETMARPKKEINWDIVEKRMEAGNSAIVICKKFNIDTDTFYRRFKEEYGCSFGDYTAIYRQCGKEDIAYTQHMKALSGNVQMLIWLGKVDLGQKDPDPVPLKPPNQTEIDKDHIIMQLKYEIEKMRNDGYQSQAG